MSEGASSLRSAKRIGRGCSLDDDRLGCDRGQQMLGSALTPNSARHSGRQLTDRNRTIRDGNPVQSEGCDGDRSPSHRGGRTQRELVDALDPLTGPPRWGIGVTEVTQRAMGDSRHAGRQ